MWRPSCCAECPIPCRHMMLMRALVLLGLIGATLAWCPWAANLRRRLGNEVRALSDRFMLTFLRMTSQFESESDSAAG
ncbi:MAG: hypothetical protein U0821_22150 [Chloroflexota bacterium]